MVFVDYLFGDMLWGCKALQKASFNKEEDWEEALRCGDLPEQQWAVQR